MEFLKTRLLATGRWMDKLRKAVGKEGTIRVGRYFVVLSDKGERF